MARRLKILLSRRLRILSILIVVVGMIAGFWYLWQIRTGKIQLSAQTELCQNQSQISAMYGSNQWSIGSQLTTVNFKGHEVLFHQLAAPWLKKVNKEISEKKIDYKFNTVETFNWRVKTTGYGQSLHSYGIAVDINPAQNPYSFSGQLITDIPRKVINIFKEYGFYWGGDWKGFVDPMHFEWYGARIYGKLTDKNTGDLLSSASVYIDGKKLTNISKDYFFAIPEGKHQIEIKDPCYKSKKFTIKVSCNQVIKKNIFLNPIPLGVPGTVKGQVKIPPESPLNLPADIYLDGVYATRTNIDGTYIIFDVPGGITHRIEAEILPIFVGSTRVKVQPGKTIRDVNITMTPGLNR